MCGIAGEAGSRQHIQNGETVVRSMLNRLKHRGPDDEGTWIGQNISFGVNLGVRRLAIIDVKGGHQPPDTHIKVVFNGEIYNHRIIRQRLESEHNIGFHSHCDTEVIAWAWQVWGLNCLDMFEGMFAIAVYDPTAEMLYLVRDRMGQKPLFFYYEPDWNTLVFASELKAILAHPLYTKAVSMQGLFDYLQLQYVPEPRTAFRDIAALEPGHFLRFAPRTGKLMKDAWWRLKPNAFDLRDENAAVEQVKETVRHAVHSRLESEVPLGVYLSGGVDSSLVAALAVEKMQAYGGEPEEIRTFTMGFENPRYDEHGWAEMVAQHLGTTHHTSIVGDPDIGRMAREIVDIYDQPFGDCSAIPTLMLARESAKFGITVALAGDGGDEAFGGYDRYRAVQLEEGVYSYFRFVSVWQREHRLALTTGNFKRLVKLYEADEWLAKKALLHSLTDPFNQMCWTDTLTYMVGDIIVKMERATMSTSIEARCPFLDHRIMETAFSIPSAYKVHRDFTKLPLRKAFAGLIPKEVWDRPKMGFGVPIGEWLRTGPGVELLKQTLWGKEHWELFDPERISILVTQHLEGKAEIGHPLWVLIMAYLWLQKHFG